jgi:hypothetical protein
VALIPFFLVVISHQLLFKAEEQGLSNIARKGGEKKVTATFLSRRKNIV